MFILKLFLCTLFGVGLAEPWGSWFNIEKTLQNAQGVQEKQEAKYLDSYNQVLKDIEVMRNDAETIGIPSVPSILPSIPGGKMFGSLTSLVANAANSTVQHAKDTLAKATKMTTQLFNSVSTNITDRGAKMLLNRLAAFIKYMDLDFVKLPPIKTNFPIMRGYASIDFEANNGTAGKLSSLVSNKTSSCVLDNSTILIDIPLTIGEMSVHYNFYKLSGFKMSTSGNLGVSVASNELNVRLRLVMDFGCAVRLEKVEVKSMENIQFKFQGLCSACGMIVEYVSTQLANFMQGVIIKQIQQTLDENIRTFLGSTPGICAVLVS